jgi:hypothetical protein
LVQKLLSQFWAQNDRCWITDILPTSSEHLGFQRYSFTPTLIVINNALPMAFVAMCFGELYAASAGIGFQMVIASATYQYQQGLAYFLITVFLLATISMIPKLIVRL